MSRPRIVIVGAGFAGFHAARTLSRTARGAAEIVLVNPTDYFLYLPLLPEVAAGVLDPRRVSVSLRSALPGVRHVLGEVGDVDVPGRDVTYVDPEGRAGHMRYDRLVVAVGSVNKLLPVPGVAEHAHGFRGLPEALYLRDHMTRQLELAEATSDLRERGARCTFVVVGAGYTGTEVAAHGARYTRRFARRRGDPRPEEIRWLLLDVADRVLPDLDPRLSRAADRVLHRLDVDVRTGCSVTEATADGLRMSDGTTVATRTVVWCVGVRPDPVVACLNLPMEQGRLVVDEYLSAPGHPEILACGDAAAVPDLTRPGSLTALTAQHAVRQGALVARNVAASYGQGRRRAYKHHDLGFVVDLGGPDAAANPLGVPLSGLPAKAVTRGYHLMTQPGNRLRVASDWVLNAFLPPQTVQLGLVGAGSVPLDTGSPELPRLPG